MFRIRYGERTKLKLYEIITYVNAKYNQITVYRRDVNTSPSVCKGKLFTSDITMMILICMRRNISVISPFLFDCRSTALFPTSVHSHLVDNIHAIQFLICNSVIASSRNCVWVTPSCVHAYPCLCMPSHAHSCSPLVIVSVTPVCACPCMPIHVPCSHLQLLYLSPYALSLVFLLMSACVSGRLYLFV